MNKRRKINFKKLLYLILILYMVFIFIQQQITIYHLDKQKMEMQKEMNTLLEQNKALKEQIKYVKSKEYIEKVAREELGLVKDNEIIYIDVSDKNAEK